METEIKEWLGGKGEEFLQGIGIKKGQSVLDFGCGIGHYTIPAAKLVGESGKVYAVDKDKHSLSILTQTANMNDLKNIVLVHNQSENLKLNIPNECIDFVLVFDVLHYFTLITRKKIYVESYRVLKSKAHLSVFPKHSKLDEPLWNLSNISVDDIIKEIEAVHFKFDEKHYSYFMHNNTLNKGYILNFIKN